MLTVQNLAEVQALINVSFGKARTSAEEIPLGGTHLLDEESGIYNIPYIKKYFPEGNVVLIECVSRVQGLMVAPGNPKGIKAFDDLVGLNYVNRQKGSGTRVLCDFLTKQKGIDTSLIYDYDREEFTHTAVAAAIAAGTADAGFGILAAAKIYGLDFIPVAEEEYDLLIAGNAYESEAVKRLIIIITGKEFAQRLNRLGGYILKNPGRIKQWN